MVPSRLYETKTDLHQMLDLLIEARSQTGDWHYPHIGEFLFNFFMVARHLDAREHIRLWHVGQKLVGFALLGEDASFDFQILPEFEWSGIEEEAIEWAEKRLAGLRRHDPEKWQGHLVSGARKDNPRRMAFLEGHGFHGGGPFSEVNMLRSLAEPLPEAGLPAGCRVCSMREVSDITNRAGAQREVWHPWSVGNVSDADYNYFMQLPYYDPELDVVTIAPDGIIAAYVNGWIDPLNQIGDLGPVGARQAYRRQGLTRAALLECMRRMRARGMDRVCISTGVSNTPAIRLYESIGFQVVNRYLEYLK